MLQNCNIFNDGAYREFTERDVRDDRMLVLEHGQPMVFGKDRDRGIRLNGLHPEVVQLGDGITEDDLLVHDQHAEDPVSRVHAVADVVAGLPGARRRAARRSSRPTHDQLLVDQIAAARAKQGDGDLAEALLAGETWTVE